MTYTTPDGDTRSLDHLTGRASLATHVVVVRVTREGDRVGPWVPYAYTRANSNRFRETLLQRAIAWGWASSVRVQVTGVEAEIVPVDDDRERFGADA